MQTNKLNLKKKTKKYLKKKTDCFNVFYKFMNFSADKRLCPERDK